MTSPWECIFVDSISGECSHGQQPAEDLGLEEGSVIGQGASPYSYSCNKRGNKTSTLGQCGGSPDGPAVPSNSHILARRRHREAVHPLMSISNSDSCWPRDGFKLPGRAQLETETFRRWIAALPESLRRFTGDLEAAIHLLDPTQGNTRQELMDMTGRRGQ